MGEVAIFFGIAVMFASVLIFIVRVPAFRSPKIRLATILGIGAVLFIGFGVGSLWARRSVDDEVASRSHTFQTRLLAYQARPLELLSTSTGFPSGTEARSEGDAVVVHSEVNHLWVYSCVEARVTTTGVSVTDTKEKCHW